ncbi:MAG: carboxypeptidase regulatory-like domain-containing protein [Gammaproteobacteria bacterium]
MARGCEGWSVRLRRQAACSLMAAAGLAAAQAAGAAALEVRVHDDASKQPLQGVAICLGTPADLRQMGAYITGSDGQVTYQDLLTAPLVLTVSKPGYRGERIHVSASASSRTLMIPLSTGGGGPVCHGPLTAAASGGEGGVAIRNFRLDRGAATATSRTVVLDFAASGEPNEYRVSENADFRDARWQSYGGRTPHFRLSAGAGRKTVYLQVRRFRTVGDSHLEITSGVARDSIVLSGG